MPAELLIEPWPTNFSMSMMATSVTSRARSSRDRAGWRSGHDRSEWIQVFGLKPPSADTPILAVGDSFTYGEDVGDLDS
jgi:hypothetical protein